MNVRLATAVFLTISLIVLGYKTTPSHGSEQVEVDLELILAVDVSPSMNAEELALQRDGYITAFRHPDILMAIRSNMLGKIAVTYVEWAGVQQQHVIIPWTILARTEDAFRFADMLSAAPATGDPGTSISGSLLLAYDLFLTSPTRGLRQVVDISGDGINNSGPPIAPMRDILLSQGIIINGLPISLSTSARNNGFDNFGVDYLKSYYENCVIGGPGSFSVAVNDMTKIAAAIKRKLILEIAARPPRVMLAAFKTRFKNFDCLAIGKRPGR